MFKIIGFIPQTSQGLFSFEDKYFAINPPFKKFSIIAILESEIDDSLPYIKEYAFYDELEYVFQHFEKMHLLEILNNKKLIGLLTSHILEGEENEIKSFEGMVKSKEASFNQDNLETKPRETLESKRLLKARTTRLRMMNGIIRRNRSRMKKLSSSSEKKK